MKEYTIYRDSWVNGNSLEGDFDEQTGTSALLNDCDRQCCLGQILSQEGMKPEDLFDKLYPYNVDKTKMPEEMWNLLVRPKSEEEMRNTGTSVSVKNSDLADEAARQNDEEKKDNSDPREREETILKIFLERDIQLTFVDGKAPWLKEWSYLERV